MAFKAFLFLFILCLPVGLHADNKPAVLLQELDQTLKYVAAYDKQKEERIASLKKQLTDEALTEDRHQVYSQLYREYEAYVYDSAFHYVKIHLDFAQKEKDATWFNECKMRLARMYSTFTRFSEAIEILKTIDTGELTDQQLSDYYNAYTEVYTYWSEYSSDDEIDKYLSFRDTYQDSALMYIQKGTYGYGINYGRKCIDMRNFIDAEKSLLPYEDYYDQESREYAILNSIIAYLYELQGRKELQKEYLIKSAIADIRGSVKENTSLQKLATLLMGEGDIARANIYIKKSMDDANFYNARLRNVQVGKILPIIDEAHQLHIENHQGKLQTAIIVIGILALFLFAVIIYQFSLMRKLSKTRKEVMEVNKELKEINRYLSETNRIKEEYIGRFLNQCSIYIEKLESYRKALNRKALSGNMDELFSALKSQQIIEDELKEFYQNFDSTFLSLFPDFVEEFNALFLEEDRITPKHESGLTVELRVFALIRLGITDSSKIADFLRYSITTIYNFRSKYRNKSVVPREQFEKYVMKIGTEI